MVMNVLFIFTFRIIFIPFVLPQDTSDALPCRICNIVGAIDVATSGYQFSMAGLPERCDAFAYGNYIFDIPNMGNTTMLKEDEDAIRSLVAEKKKVYTWVNYFYEEPWDEIFDPKDQALYNQRMNPLLQKITDLEISGIVLCITDIYSGEITNIPDKIKAFITKVKQEMPTLKFGIYVDASYAYDKITNNALFDFSVTNSVIDMYFVRMFTRNFTCDDVILNTGTQIKSSDPHALSLEKLCNTVSQSSMDKEKVIALVHLAVLQPVLSGCLVTSYSQAQ